MKLVSRLLEKPWGQIGVPHSHSDDTANRIGEVCFDHPEAAAMPVTIKYLYTSERLSIQVHPDNEQARANGHACGKDEMWIVLDAEPDATIGLGLRTSASRSELRQAMIDGSIAELVDWRPVSPGDVIYNRAGTIHAAGAGLVLLEIQQSADLTYRLFDYGRPRELHLEEALTVARCEPHRGDLDRRLSNGQSTVLVDGPHFGVAWCDGVVPGEIPRAAGHYQLAVVRGEAFADGALIRPGECGLVDDVRDIELASGAVAAITWPTLEQAVEAMARAA